MLLRNRVARSLFTADAKETKTTLDQNRNVCRAAEEDFVPRSDNSTCAERRCNKIYSEHCTEHLNWSCDVISRVQPL